MPDALLNLPWVIQLSLASGYAAYLLCYAGIRGKHTTVDVTFLTLTFGLIATGIAYLANMNAKPVVASLLAFMLTCAAGLLWRRFLRKGVRWFLRQADVSWSDDDPTALASIIFDSTHRLSQIAVLTDDGVWLRCDNLVDYKDCAFGPCKIGAEGDVAMYVTHSVDKDGMEKEFKTTKDPEYGDRITFIPASKIKRINFRHAP